MSTGPKLRLERITTWGQVTPEGEWYDQATDEWVMLMRGEARLGFDDGREVSLSEGDHVFLPAGCKHRVSWVSTSDALVWLALHVSVD